MQIGDGFQLTYCTNIHPANGWAAVFASLQQYAPALKAQLAPDRPFGIGLRLSGQESYELLQDDHLSRLQTFLATHELYVFTLNGFPYGPFHGQPVKANVHAPDWRNDERVQYTLRLVYILAALLPPGMDGSISTSPLSYKAWINSNDTATWRLFTHNLMRVVALLVQIEQEQGKCIHLDLEPEPDGLLENSSELIQFFQCWLLTEGAVILADMVGITLELAQHSIREHLRMCLDTCHVAVAYEEPATVVERLAQHGIKIGKVQVSSALRIPLPDNAPERAALAQALQPFVESTYLHQVIQRNHDHTFHHYPDLVDALPLIADPRAAEWRIHFHVPIFVQHYDTFFSTQETIIQTLALLQKKDICAQLEIETYTWEVLPSALKVNLLESISREYNWVLNVLR